MGIADFFRPKYRHSDVKVRLAAVRALTTDDADILASVARDDREPAVRRVAIEKLDEADLLAEIAAREDDRALRDLAGGRAAALWVTVACADDEDDARGALDGLARLGDHRALAEVAGRAALGTVRDLALGKIGEPRALAELARTTTDPALRARALAAIGDADVLRAIAVDTTVKELGLAALDRLDGEAVLEQIAHKAKHKAVRQRARKKLDDLAEAARAARPKADDEARRRHAEQAQLVREVERVADSFDWDASGAVIARAEARWTELGGDPSADRASVERFWRAVERWHGRRRIADEQAGAHRAQLEEQRRERARDGAAAPPATAELIAEPPAPPPEERPRRSERDRPERDRPDDDAAAAERAAERREAEQRARQLAASLEALIGELEAMAASTDGRAIDRLLEQAARAFGQVGRAAADRRADLERRYQEARAALVIKVQELREAEDWQRWANVPRAEALIREAAALLEQDTPGLDALKALQGRWKGLGPLPRKKSQELWEQFKATADQVFAKVKAARGVAAEQAKAVAQVKEALIAEAEALADSTDWVATAERLKDLQRRWKESGHLPRKQADALWKKFRAACDRFFERRKPHLDAQLAEQVAALEAKQALCERAEAVVAGAPGDGGWGAAITEIRALQRRWKELGLVPRKDADAINRRFRAACDALFARRDEARDAEAEAQRARLGEVRAELDAVAALDGREAIERLVALRARLRELAGDELRDPALDEAVARRAAEVIARSPDAAAGTELDPEAMRARRDKLVARAEELLPRARPSIDAAASPDEIAARLKEALATNALGDFRGAGPDPLEVVADLRAQWGAIGPVVGEASEALAARFEEMCAKVVAAAEAEGRRRPEPADDERPRRDERRRGRREDRRERRDERAPAAAPPPVAEATPPPAALVAEPAPPPAALVAAPAPPPAAPVAEPAPAPAAAATPDPEPRPSPTPPAAPAPADDIDAGWD